VQRLFSTFPGSWPGLGLLLLRLTVGFACLVGLADRVGFDGLLQAAAGLPLLALLLCVAVGLATPVVCPMLVLALFLAGRGLSVSSWVMMAGGSLSLMLLGPGAWSLDAWLYGRKRIRFDGD
jgi:hypothetical protein